ncbi:MAG TPA: hypothetical protein VJU15_15265 [Gemmatimonadales bacterium]|nr:hypothetical protein [Gemmatimonadales bacterium]
MRLPLVIGLFTAPTLMAQSEPISPPCAAVPRRALDFWVGNWTVTDPAGTPAGKNEITRIAGGCGLLERWESPGPNGSTFRGVGHHAYDPSLGAWRQLWTDTSGRTVDMEGEAKDGAVIYRWKISGTTPALGRYTVSAQSGGKVRQHGERSTDGGKSWRTTFDYLYSRADGWRRAASVWRNADGVRPSRERIADVK